MVICAVQQLVKCVLPELELCTSLVQTAAGEMRFA